MFKQYDIVKITKPQTGEWGTLRTGSKGTIVEVYKAGAKVGYDVEFVTSTGRTKAIVILGAKDIEPVKPVLKKVPTVTDFRKRQALPAARAKGTKLPVKAKASKPAARAKVAMQTTRGKASALTTAKRKAAKNRPAPVSRKKTVKAKSTKGKKMLAG